MHFSELRIALELWDGTMTAFLTKGSIPVNWPSTGMGFDRSVSIWACRSIIVLIPLFQLWYLHMLGSCCCSCAYWKQNILKHHCNVTQRSRNQTTNSFVLLQGKSRPRRRKLCNLSLEIHIALRKLQIWTKHCAVLPNISVISTPKTLALPESAALLASRELTILVTSVSMIALYIFS